MTIEQAKAIIEAADLSVTLTAQEQADLKKALQVLAGSGLRSR